MTGLLKLRTWNSRKLHGLGFMVLASFLIVASVYTTRSMDQRCNAVRDLATEFYSGHIQQVWNMDRRAFLHARGLADLQRIEGEYGTTRSKRFVGCGGPVWGLPVIVRFEVKRRDMMLEEAWISPNGVVVDQVGVWKVSTFR